MAQVPHIDVDRIGDGVTTIFDFDFPYQTASEVFVTVDGVDTPYTWLAGSTQSIQLLTPAALGAKIRIYRSTLAYVPRHLFDQGVPFLPRYVDENNRQLLFAVQEGVDLSNTASELANGVNDKADAAVEAAERAELAATEALSVANGVDGKATDALAAAQRAEQVANDASTVANSVDTKATNALAAANRAEATADAVDGKATQALSDAATALAIAQGVDVSFPTYATARTFTGTSDIMYIGGRQNIFDGAHGHWAVHRTGTAPAEDGGTILRCANGWWLTRHFQGDVDPIWFGSVRGAGTPTSTGEDITNAPWNAWPSFVNGTSFLGQPGHNWGNAAFLAANKPFTNADTWDRIALQLAAWTLNPVRMQDGGYLLSAPLRWTNSMYNGLHGNGLYRSRITYANISTFTRIGRLAPLIQIYRIGGPPLTMSDFATVGVSGYVPQAKPETAAANVITGISLVNANGVHLDRLWVSGGGDLGVDLDTSCSDCFIDGCTMEYNGASVSVGNLSAVRVSNSNLWQTYGYQYPCGGVVGYGTGGAVIYIANTKFVGFSGRTVESGPHRVVWLGGGVEHPPGAGAIALAQLQINLRTTGCSVTGVDFNLGAGGLSPVITLGNRARFTGNTVRGSGFTHMLMNVSLGTANSVSHTSITDNLFDVSGTSVEGPFIGSIVDGSAYVGGCTKCLYDGNTNVYQDATKLGWSASNTIGTNQWA